ncbi:MAG: tRNA dihydrouridine synthase [Candidatus Saccharimonadales bacterium]
MDLFENLPKPFFVLSPMDDVTDTVFRQVIASLAAPDLFFTEFVNVDGLQSPGRIKLLDKLKFSSRDTPLIAQIWGKDPNNFYKTAQQLADGTFADELDLPKGLNFAGIDLNMGCPEKTAVKNGTCSALINNRPLAAEIIAATLEGAAGRLPVSLKTRLGFSSIDLSWPEFLLGQRLATLSFHARTRQEMSKVPAHLEVLGQISALRNKLSPTTKIVGNGDIISRRQGMELAKQYGLDGIMIGRGIFQDPFLFAKNSLWPGYTKSQKISLYESHVKLFARTWNRTSRSLLPLNKFCKIYIQGFDGAKELREQLMHSQTIDDLLNLLELNQHKDLVNSQ